MNSINVWNPSLYDQKMQFVSKYGESLIDILSPREGERILDLGCGTGELTAKIAEHNALVTGIDYSEEMINAARNKYSHIQFNVGEGQSFVVNQPYDAIFSNAALHWMKDAKGVLSSVHQALKPKGRFVAEFGGKGNIQSIIESISYFLQHEYSIDAKERNPWYFPSIGEYSVLLEETGFKVLFAQHFNRITPLADGEDGMQQWLESFAGDFVTGLSHSKKKHLFGQVTKHLKPQLYIKGQFEADYQRIRIVAIRE